MPKTSLVVCLYKERDLLERLLENADGCYDDLVVVHDGPEISSGQAKRNENSSPPSVPSHLHPELAIDFSDPSQVERAKRLYHEPQAPATGGSIHEIVARFGGRYLEGPRCWQQEPHWPMAWQTAKHDWILRLDADEFPGKELGSWLRKFQTQDEPPSTTSGFTCIWPLWNGERATTKLWPDDRIFLFNRNRVRFFGLVEQVPIPDESFEKTQLTLHHQPHRKSFGVRNIIFRKQAYRWREVIAKSLSDSPLKLPRWRWINPLWPPPWDAKRRTPLRLAFFALIWFPTCQAVRQIKSGQFPDLSACLNPGLHHFLLQLKIWQINRIRKSDRATL